MAVGYESMVADYMDANAVVSLDDYVKSTKYGLTKAETDDFVPAFWEANKYPQFKNQMLSFPFTKSMLAMYYNADMLKAAGIAKVPETWDDFQAACDALQKNNIKCLAISVDASTIDGWIFSRGGTLLSDDEKSVKFNAAPAYDSLTLIQTLVKKGEAYQISKANADEADFGAKRVAFAFATTSGLSYWDKAVAGQFNWGVAVLPHATDVQPVTVQYGGDITIFKSTPEKQLAAWLFVKYFTSKDVTAKWAAASNYTPVRTSAFDTAPIQQRIQALPQYGTAIKTILPYAKPEPYVKGWQPTRTFLEDGLVAVINGTKEPKAAIDDAAALANKALAQ
jgi:multiple sugar transport system substrate-binding protein